MPVTGIGGGPQRLFGPAALAAANATLFTAQVPTILRDIKLGNVGASGTVTISINGTAVGNQLLGVASVAASSEVTFAQDIPLNAGDTVQGLGATTITCVLTGEVAGQGAA